MRRLSVVLLSIVILIGSLLVGGGHLVAAQDATPADEAPPEGVTFEFVGGANIDELPVAPVAMYLVRVTLEPGASFPSEADDPSLALVVIEAGTITFTVKAPISVLHPPADGEVSPEDFEAYPAGQAFTMEVGDSAVFPASTAGEVRNDGTENAVLLAAIIEPDGQGGATPAA